MPYDHVHLIANPKIWVGNTATLPAGAQDDDFFYDVQTKKLYCYHGGAWNNLEGAVHAHAHVDTTGQTANQHHVAFVQVDHDALANPHHGTFVQADHDALANPHHATAHGDAQHGTDVASLVGAKVPTVELGGAGADSTKFLRGDQTWAIPAGGGGGVSTLKTTADQIINGTAFQNITGLAFSVLANTDYAFKFHIVFRSAATTTGFRFSVNGPAGAAVEHFMTYQTVANSELAGVATWLQKHSVAFDQMTVLAATIAAGVDLVCMIEGRVKVGATAGTFAARVASELANNDLVVQKGSWGMFF